MSAVIVAFEKCVPAIDSRVMIERKSLSDKEFHFQNWIRGRLDEVGSNYETGGRNTNLMPKTAENPMAGIKHEFGAWGLKSGSDEPVSMK